MVFFNSATNFALIQPVSGASNIILHISAKLWVQETFKKTKWKLDLILYLEISFEVMTLKGSVDLIP